MTTTELIHALRQKVTGFAVDGDRDMTILLTEAADRLEEQDERIAIMCEIQDGKWTDG